MSFSVRGRSAVQGFAQPHHAPGTTYRSLRCARALCGGRRARQSPRWGSCLGAPLSEGMHAGPHHHPPILLCNKPCAYALFLLICSHTLTSHYAPLLCALCSHRSLLPPAPCVQLREELMRPLASLKEAARRVARVQQDCKMPDVSADQCLNKLKACTPEPHAVHASR